MSQSLLQPVRHSWLSPQWNLSPPPGIPASQRYGQKTQTWVMSSQSETRWYAISWPQPQGRKSLESDSRVAATLPASVNLCVLNLSKLCVS